MEGGKTFRKRNESVYIVFATFAAAPHTVTPRPVLPTREKNVNTSPYAPWYE